MAVFTTAKQNKMIRHLEIKTTYNKLMEDPESQKYGAYEFLAKKYNCSPTTIGRIVGNIKPLKTRKA